MTAFGCFGPLEYENGCCWGGWARELGLRILHEGLGFGLEGAGALKWRTISFPKDSAKAHAPPGTRC